MSRYLIILILFSISFTSAAQNDTNIESRKGKLFFKIGSDYRITPIYGSNIPKEDILINTNIDSQSSGAAPFYGVEFFTGKNWSINFSQSFHYTLFSYEGFDATSQENGYSEASNALFIDFHFYVNYYFKVFKESEFL